MTSELLRTLISISKGDLVFLVEKEEGKDVSGWMVVCDEIKLLSETDSREGYPLKVNTPEGHIYIGSSNIAIIHSSEQFGDYILPNVNHVSKLRGNKMPYSQCTPVEIYLGDDKVREGLKKHLGLAPYAEFFVRRTEKPAE